MKFPFYKGNGERPFNKIVELPVSKRSKLMFDPEKYIADSGLVDACNVALLMEQPLLLTGEPGTGKTQFAYSLAWEFGLGKPLKFETKSTSEAENLFYIYDALRHFQDTHIHKKGEANEAPKTLDYITYNALGEAILKTKDESEVKHLLPSNFEHSGKKRSVVLIDEIDKAPRDFPNDVLNELEQIYFRIPQLKNERIDADPEFQPIVIITSNSEKDLPDAFLRRCIYYDLSFPKKESLENIVANRLDSYKLSGSRFLKDALDLFYKLREGDLRKNPATAEFLGWIISLREIYSEKENPLVEYEHIFKTLGNLVKTKEDQNKAKNIIKAWVENDSSD